MRSLLWKEWHEQRWKLAFGSLILAAFAFIGLRARVIADEQLVQWVCFLAIALLPVLASTGLIPAERDDGTLETLLSLPVNASRIFAVKTAIGVLLAAGPLLVAGAVSLAVAGGREISAADIATLYLRTTATTLALFFLMFTLTVRLPNETRASLITLALLIMSLLVTLAIVDSNNDYQRAHSPLWLISPFVFLVSRGTETPGAGLRLGAALVQAAVALLLWLWAARQFPRPTVVEGNL